MPQISIATGQGDEPVYRQVARQLRDMVSAGQLPAGFRLPSVRTLASDLGVNLNTVARAYRLLQDEGFIAIQGRSGAEVRGPASAKAEQIPEPFRRDLRETLAKLRQAGLSREALRRLVIAEIADLKGG